MRIFFSLIFSALISIALFFGMQLLISNDSKISNEKDYIPHLVYLMDEEDLKLERKKRIKPKEPKKNEISQKIDMVKIPISKVEQNIKVKPITINIPKIVDISTISSLDTAQISIPKQTVFNAYGLQTLKRVNPKYPRRAKLQRKEGYVELSFTINEAGEVLNVNVIDSKPKGFFEDEAIKAIKKWHFKPSDEAKNATIKFNFRLAG